MTLLTEQEAKERWCPFGKVALDVYDGSGECVGSTTVNRVSGGTRNGQPVNGSKCLASTCMAWRWFDTVTDDGTGVNLRPTAHVARMPDRNPRPHSERRGFCGLAGRPE